MEFQFGTNWAEFSKTAGGVIGQTLAMEGVFSFFLESTSLGLFLFGETKLGRIGHWWAAFFVFLGSWLSGYFIIATNAWMQHPVGYQFGAHHEIELTSFWDLLFNNWAVWQYAHTMLGAVQTGCFVMAAVGAFYVLSHRDPFYGRTFLRIGVLVGVIASLLQLEPSGDMQGKMITQYQPTTLAAMEGLFESQDGAPLAILGQPDVPKRTLDNPLVVPNIAQPSSPTSTGTLTFQGLNDFPQDQWPDKIELLYFSYHVMVGLGTMFIAIMVLSAFLLWRKKLFDSRWMLWIIMLSVPLPYIANTAGWLTAEIGRQPWLIYGLMRTAHGFSPRVNSQSNAWFTLIASFMEPLYGSRHALALHLFIVKSEKSGPSPKRDPAGKR